MSLASRAHSVTPALIVAVSVVCLGGLLLIAFPMRDASADSVTR